MENFQKEIRDYLGVAVPGTLVEAAESYKLLEHFVTEDDTCTVGGFVKKGSVDGKVTGAAGDGAVFVQGLHGAVGEEHTGAVQIGLLGTINVKVVRVSGRNDRGIRCEMMKGAVKLIRLNHHIGALAVEQIIAIEVLGNTPQKGTASATGNPVQPGGQGRGRGFTVAACDA